MNKSIQLLFLCIAIILASCSSDSNDVYLGYEYFPVNVGHWVEYDVDSIIKDEFTGGSDTFQFQIREEIDSIFVDLSGNPTQRLERFKRNTDSDPWVIHKVWTSNLNDVNAQKVEDNVRFIKLIFPVKLFEDWDGNAFNTLNPSDYEYSDVHAPTTINNLNFDSSLTVTQVLDTLGLISDIIEIEQYATHVGMIFKEQIEIEKDFVVDTILSAKVYRERIKAYGN